MTKRKSPPWAAISFGAHDGAATATGETRRLATRYGFTCEYFSWPPEHRNSIICEQCPRRDACRAIQLSARPSYGAIDSESRHYSHAGSPRAYGTGIVATTAAEAPKR